MKINELKVGDRVKYYAPKSWILDTTIVQGNISSFGKSLYDLEVVYIDLGTSELRIEYKDIISKIEYKKGCKCGICRPNRYKEIKIDHPLGEISRDYTQFEESLNNPTAKIYTYPIPETTYHCPKCDKKLWGLCGLPIKQYNNEPCEECKNKEKSAPKSFKFNISFLDDFEIEQNGQKASFKLTGSEIKYFPDCGELKFGKTYTIEIKEKD